MADISLDGKRVLIREDLNVPLSNGKISSDARIRAALPTVRAALDANAAVMLMSHLGRPAEGQSAEEFSLKPVADHLGKLLDRKVPLIADWIEGVDVEPGSVVLLENVRFLEGEKACDAELSKKLGGLCDIFVMDAFGTAHRAHASTAGMVPHLADRAAGLLLAAELEHLRVVLEPERPLLCLLGGAKVSDKLGVLEALEPHADVLAIGGAMAYTFLAARDQPTGSSRVERERIDDAHRVLDASRSAGNRLLLPRDHIVATQLSADAPSRTVETIPEGWMGVDIGPRTATEYAAEARTAKTIFWNGPMGVFELAPFAHGTEAVAHAVAESEGTSVVGGGDSLAAVNRLGTGDQFGHLSTGGGAALQYIQGISLPGVAALESNA